MSFLAAAQQETLILAPAAVVAMWRGQLERWGVKGIAVSYDTFRSRYEKEFVDAAKNRVLVLDEAHKVKNRDAKITRLVAGEAEKAAFVVAATGTPFQNAPGELLTVLQTAQVREYKVVYLAADWKEERFGRKRVRRLVWKSTDAMRTLRVALERSWWYLRRELKDVVKNLPQLVREVHEVEGSKLATYLKKIDKELEALEQKYLAEDKLEQAQRVAAVRSGLFSEADLGALFPIASTLRRLLAEAKIAAACEVVEAAVDQVAEDEGVLFFAHHEDVIKELCAALQELEVPHAVIAGEVDSAERQRIADKFQAGELKALVLSTRAAGEGLTLSRAGLAVFFELDWNPAALTQAENRIMNITSTTSKLVRYVIAPHVLERRMVQLVNEKAQAAETVYASKGSVAKLSDATPVPTQPQSDDDPDNDPNPTPTPNPPATGGDAGEGEEIDFIERVQDRVLLEAFVEPAPAPVVEPQAQEPQPQEPQPQEPQAQEPQAPPASVVELQAVEAPAAPEAPTPVVEPPAQEQDPVAAPQPPAPAPVLEGLTAPPAPQLVQPAMFPELAVGGGFEPLFRPPRRSGRTPYWGRGWELHVKTIHNTDKLLVTVKTSLTSLTDIFTVEEAYSFILQHVRRMGLPMPPEPATRKVLQKLGWLVFEEPPKPPKGGKDTLPPRPARVGFSEIATVMGANPWKTAFELWEEKTGRRDPEPPSLAMEWGASTEKQAMNLFLQRQWGMTPPVWTRGRNYQKPAAATDAPLAGVVDFVVKDPAGERVVVEVKVSASGVGLDMYKLQVNAQLGALGLRKGYIVMLVSNKYFLVEEVLFDSALYEQQKQAARDFMRSVQNDTPPLPPLPTEDDPASPGSGSIYTEDEDFTQLVAQAKALQEQLSEIEEKFEALKKQIRERLETSALTRVRTRAGVVEVKLIESERFDTKRFKAEHAELAKQYLKTTTYTQLKLL
jgi:predicted phage-related endonuclease